MLSDQGFQRVWLKTVWGFDPEHWGALGFSKSANRRHFLDQYKDGDLVLFYGAQNEHTPKEQRRQILGFADVDPEEIELSERLAPDALQRKNTSEFRDKWNFALPMKRAWKFTRPNLSVAHFAKKTFEKNEARLIASRGVLLGPEEAQNVLRLPVKQVNVFGEPPLSAEILQEETPINSWKPSRGFTPSFGKRNSEVTDGETYLYVLVLEASKGASLANFLGCQPHEIGKKRVVKIGISKNPQDRADAHNKHLPPACAYKWRLESRDKIFAGAAEAKLAEDETKIELPKRFESLGGEFYCIDLNELKTELLRIIPIRHNLIRA